MFEGSLAQQDRFRIASEDIRGSVEVLKEGRMFINSLPGGEIPASDIGALGFYFADTRFLSCLEIKLNQTEPIFLSRTMRDSHLAQVEMANKAFTIGEQVVPLQTIHIRLLRMIKDGFYQRVRIVNYNQYAMELNLQFKLGADFADIFEVRGMQSSKIGTVEKSSVQGEEVVLSYLGKDNVRRCTKVSFRPKPTMILEEDSYIYVSYDLKLKPKEKNYIYLKVTPLIENENEETCTGQIDLGFSNAAQYLIDSYQQWKDDCIRISSDNEAFDFMTKVAVTDLRSLSTTYPEVGTVIEAGIPWYAAPFGRDALITAWQTLLVNPDLAKESLLFLAKYQGREVNPWRDEQPGKIMHEIRFGEMARAGEIPHTPYYGSVDSTLWFIILLAEYVRWTGNLDFLFQMSEHLLKALEWCEKYGDVDDDGYIEYLCRSDKGLVNQGWKDSWDGVVDTQGKIPSGPIALVEVQGYYYKALKLGADMFDRMGDESKAKGLRQKAEQLRKNFLRDYWREDEGFLAFALDGNKNAIDTVVSNPGHCLFAGILGKKQACKVIKRLMQTDLFSGWGIRTMSINEVAYNPMSYHNGTVWPHDNAIIGFGIREAGEITPLQHMVETLFEAAEFFNHMRLPELFCGFTREGKIGPVKYPIACEPQAWAIGSIFHMIRALLGIQCYGTEIYVRNPHLPGFLRTLRLENIRVGSGTVALEFTKRQGKTYCGVIGTRGSVKVIIQ